jgi:hypothetical protein
LRSIVQNTAADMETQVTETVVHKCPCWPACEAEVAEKQTSEYVYIVVAPSFCPAGLTTFVGTYRTEKEADDSMERLLAERPGSRLVVVPFRICHDTSDRYTEDEREMLEM